MQLAEAMKKAGLVSDNAYKEVVREKTKKMIEEISQRHVKKSKNKDNDVTLEDFEEDEE